MEYSNKVKNLLKYWPCVKVKHSSIVILMRRTGARNTKNSWRKNILKQIKMRFFRKAVDIFNHSVNNPSVLPCYFRQFSLARQDDQDSSHYIRALSNCQTLHTWWNGRKIKIFLAGLNSVRMPLALTGPLLTRERWSHKKIEEKKKKNYHSESWSDMKVM